MRLYQADIEQQIIQLFGRGDASVMRRLYDSYAGVLAGICARYITDVDDQKDVLQESLIQIYTHISSFTYQGRGSLLAWMARITINQALMFLRAQASATMMGEVENIADDTTDEPDVAGLSEGEILDMIRRLPVGYRTVFNLYAIEGKSHKEIAAALGIKPDTSASQYKRARTMLAQMIKDYKRQI